MNNRFRALLRRQCEKFRKPDQTRDQPTALSGKALLNAHRRVRQSARERVRGLRVEPVLPPDVLGIFVLLPMPGA